LCVSCRRRQDSRPCSGADLRMRHGLITGTQLSCGAWRLAVAHLPKLTNAILISRTNKPFGGNLLLSRRRPLSPRDDERERITRARRAAEALFTTQRQVTQQLVSDPLPSVDQSARRPRVLRALSSASGRPKEGKLPVEFEQRITPAIPRSQFARIRPWVRYGMTVAQVAGIYGVAVDVIERILRQA
jgi:hypothetical protein